MLPYKKVTIDLRWITDTESFHAPPDGVFVLELENVDDFKKRCPELYADLIECSAFVNWRRMEDGEESPVLVLSFCEENT